MAGLGVGGWGNFPGQPQNTPIANPQQNIPSPGRSRGNFRNMQGRGQGQGRGGMDTGPSRPQPFRGPAGGGGINTGRTSLMGALPSVGDPFRTYGSVENGRVIPPSNPYGQNQPIKFTPGGEWGGGGINTGPSRPPWMETPDGGGNPWLERGGFTGGQMPPDFNPFTSLDPGRSMLHSGSAGAQTGYYKPQSQIPMNSGGGRFGGPQMGGGSGFRGMYRNSF